MRRALLALGLTAGAACTTFNFARPSETTGDASVDAASDVEAGATDAGAEAGTSFLPTDLATKLCAAVFKCGRLSEAIELSLALPLNTPASPLNFSSCMDWVAGPLDPKRPGLALQQGILTGVANAGTCGEAEAQLPVQYVKTDAGCTSGCADNTTLAVCSPTGQTYTAACSSAWFGQSGACFAPDAGITGGADAGGAYCVSLGACPSGASCMDTNTLRDCYPPGNDSFTAWNCAISGRQCDSASGHVAACVVPGKLAPPCVLREVKDTCDGNAVVHCAGGFMPQTEIDCAPVGGSCSTVNAAGVARCVRPGDQCGPFDPDVNVCNGSSITVCIAGVKQSVDCSTVATGTTCQPADATHSAHCG